LNSNRGNLQKKYPNEIEAIYRREFKSKAIIEVYKGNSESRAEVESRTNHMKRESRPKARIEVKPTKGKSEVEVEVD